MIRAEQGRVLGVLPTRRWIPDGRHEAEMSQLMTQALVEQKAPDTRIAALIALVHALKCEQKIVDPRRYGLSGRNLRARAEAIAKSDWAPQPIRKAIDEMIAAVAAIRATEAASRVDF